mgnify:CR=1 FL=1
MLIRLFASALILASSMASADIVQTDLSKLSFPKPKIASPFEQSWYLEDKNIHSIMLDEKRAYYGRTDGWVVAYSRNPGVGQEWTFEADSEVRSMAVLNNVLVVGTKQGYLFGIARDSGEVLWERPIGGAINNLVADGDQLLATSYNVKEEHTAILLLGDDGTEIWQYRLNKQPDKVDASKYSGADHRTANAINSLASHGISQIHLAGDVVLFATSDWMDIEATLNVLNRKDGSVRWSKSDSKNFVLHQNWVYVKDPKGDKIKAFDLQTGQRLGPVHDSHNGGIKGDVIVAEDGVLYSDQQCYFYKSGLRSGVSDFYRTSICAEYMFPHNGNLLYLNSAGSIGLLDTEDGARLWNDYFKNQKITAPPQKHGNGLLIEFNDRWLSYFEQSSQPRELTNK